MKINLKKISRVIGIPLEIVENAWPDLVEDEEPIFKTDDKYFWSARLCIERQQFEKRYIQIIGAAKRGGQASAQARGKLDGQPDGQANGQPDGQPYQDKDKDKDTSNNKTRSLSLDGRPNAQPNAQPNGQANGQAHASAPAALIKELDTEAKQAVDSLIEQSISLGMYGSPKDRNRITLQVMKKSYFSWAKICNLNQSTTPKWRAAFIDEYKKQFYKNRRTP